MTQVPKSDSSVFTDSFHDVIGQSSPRNLKYLGALGAVALAATTAAILRSHLALPNLLMVFLLAVLATAVFWGLRPSILASILSVLVFDFFFVHPFLTLTISSSQDVLSLIAFLIVAILTSNLTGRIRDQAVAARQREARTAALYDLSRDIAGATGLSDVLEAVVHRVAHILGATVVVLLPEHDELLPQAAYPHDTRLTDAEYRAAISVWESNMESGKGTGPSAGEPWLYLPLGSSEGASGVLGLCFTSPDMILVPEQRRLAEALVDQVTVAIERARFADDLEQAHLLRERERLQAILLSSISHDLRTPLASIFGSATSLLENDTAFDTATRIDLLMTIREEAERLNRFVGNLLDTTRLESGALKLNPDWVAIDDIIGSALQRMKATLAGRNVEIVIEPRLPLLHVDFVLVEQVFVNLLDNAAKYSPPGTLICVAAHRASDAVEISIEDQGIGLPVEALERCFDKFYRVEHADRQPAGTGLGLSICRGIIEEHGGTIYAQSPGPSGRGSLFTVRLPVEDAPSVPDEQLS